VAKKTLALRSFQISHTVSKTKEVNPFLWGLDPSAMEDHHSRIDRPLQAKPHLEIVPNPCSEMTMNKKMIMSTCQTQMTTEKMMRQWI
jgi:hypothetical protein